MSLAINISERRLFKVLKLSNLIIVALISTLAVVVLLSLSIGAVSTPVWDIVAMILSKFGITESPLSEVQETVIFNIRLPRILTGIMVGGALGSAGAALQGLFRNPLVEPSLIGISGGASLMAVITIVFIVSGLANYPILGKFIIPIAAFVGSLGATLIAYNLSKENGKTSITKLILVGVAINAMVYALVGLTIYFADDAALRAFTFWNLGDLGGSTWEKSLWFAPFIILPLIGLLSCIRWLDAFALGETEAFYLGVKTENAKYVIISLSAFTVGASVALAGTIGFIGLVVPHIFRTLFGSSNKIVLPGSVLGGAALLILADLIARNIAAPSEVPIGIITALIGAPFFIYLLVKKSKYSIS